MLEWHSSDPTVAFVDPHGPNLTTTLRAMREGVVNITASVPGSQAAVTVYVTAQPPSMGRLEVVDFRMVQFQYPSSTRWDYAPLMRVREASGKGAVYVISVDFDIPGAEAVGPIPWLRTLNAGTTYDFFAMFYGDFDLTLGSSTVPLAGTMARARITTTDSLGAPLVVTVTGPVVTN